MDEQTLIERYFRHATPGGADVLLGIGDDAAVLRPPPGRDLVVATDTQAEGTHFPPGTPPAAIGHRCLAVNLSDLAAMGAEPLWCTLALALPQADAAWLEAFAAGFTALAERAGIVLVGGDTVRGPLAATVTVLGHVRPGKFIRRDGARAGHAVYVTGWPGEAVAGRALLSRGAPAPGDPAESLWRRFCFPEPRLAAGLALVELASAMIDCSDGLHDDLGKLVLASGVGARLDAGALPISAALRAFGGAQAAEMALTGGDDYELLFTVPPERSAELARVEAQWSLPVTRLGEITSQAGVTWLRDGQPWAFDDQTYRHFQG